MATDKIQQLFMVKVLERSAIQWTYLNIKGIYSKTIAKIKLNDEIFIEVLVKLETEQDRIVLSTISIQYSSLCFN